MSARPIIRCTSSSQYERWLPTTLDQLGKHEEFLEDVLATSPELMGLETRRTGVRGPFKCFRQVSMQTPLGRGILPDIVMFAASGHVIVVEVKRYVNPELRDRAVIAQIIDYASSFAALTESQCVELFGMANATTWTECVEAMFKDDSAVDELAEVLYDRMQTGELNLVIACDKIPAGLTDVVSGITSQSALAFDLDVIEVAPHIRDGNESSEILFVPSTRLSTEIVSRTAVTVTYREGDPKPSTSVQTTSLEEVEKKIKAANRRLNPEARAWTDEEVEAEVQAVGRPITRKLFEFIKQHSADGQFLAAGKKLRAIFGFYVDGLRDGVPKRLMVFNCGADWSEVYIYMNFAESIVSADTAMLFRRKLKDVLGDGINVDRKEASVPLDVIEEHLEDFNAIMLWFKAQANARLPE